VRRMSWYDERDPALSLDHQPRKRDWKIESTGFKARGHGAWAWHKGQRADRSPKYLIDPRDERIVWLRPRSKRRRAVDKARVVDEAIRSKGTHITTLDDRM
jgi:hypothetical protein